MGQSTTLPGNKGVELNSISRYFEEQAERTPGSPALVFNDQVFTYGHLNDKANQLAHFLQEKGVDRESVVGILMDRCPDYIVAIIAILKAGGAYMPLDTSLPMSRIALKITDSACMLILAHTGLSDLLPADATPVFFTDAIQSEIQKHDTGNPVCINLLHDLAYIMYTSGSTGKPNGVGIPHAGVIRLVRDTNFVELYPGQTFLQLAPLGFDAATFEIWAPLLNGGTCVLYAGRFPEIQQLEKIISEHQISTLFLTTALFNLIIDEKPEIFLPVKFLLFGGEATSVKHVKKAKVHLPDTLLINVYGPTENTTFTTFYPVPELLQADSSVIPIGKAISGTCVYILDENLNQVQDGDEGELFTGGKGLARSYINNQQLTGEKFITNPFSLIPGEKLYKTGDICRYTPDGNIEFLRRVDHQVKIRGFRIETGEIESVLSMHPCVSQVIIMARKSSGSEKTLVAYIVKNQKAEINQQDLRSYLAGKLPDYMIPGFFIFLQKMPLTDNGKIDRALLPPPESKSHTMLVEEATGADMVQEAIAGIWKKALNLADIGLNDNFFEFGGHSLIAIKIMFQVNEMFSTSFPVSSVFEYPTIAKLSARVKLKEGTSDPSYIFHISKGTGEQPVFIIPGLGANPFQFLLFAKYLDSSISVYCLEYPGHNNSGVPLQSVEEMATFFISHIRKIQEHGPYTLISYSFGGKVAFEMALQLTRSGEGIASFVCIGGEAPGFSITVVTARQKVKLYTSYLLRLPIHLKKEFILEGVIPIMGFYSSKLFVKINKSLKRFLSQKRYGSTSAQNSQDGEPEDEKMNKLLNAWYKYRPYETLDHDLLFLKDSELEQSLTRNTLMYYFLKARPDWGWGKYFTRKTECLTFEVDHNGIFREPVVQQLAKVAEEYIKGP